MRSPDCLAEAQKIINMMLQKYESGAVKFPRLRDAASENNVHQMASVIKCVIAGQYVSAEQKMKLVVLPNVNGVETVFKLHARLIVRSYEESTTFFGQSSTNWSTLFASSDAGSKAYIGRLKAFIKEGSYSTTANQFRDLLRSGVEHVGVILKTVLKAYGVLDKPELSGERALAFWDAALPSKGSENEGVELADMLRKLN